MSVSPHTHQHGILCLWLYLLFHSQNPVRPQPREGGARGPLWALRVGSWATLRVASFPPCSQLQPFPQRPNQWPRCVWQASGGGCGQSRGEEEGGIQLARPVLAGERGVRVGVLGGRNGPDPHTESSAASLQGQGGDAQLGEGEG